MKDLHPIISENLTVLRKSSGLTQAQLAERLNYSDKAISRWEKGDTLPDINVLYELCDFYGITMEVLLEKGGGSDKKQIKVKSSMQYAAMVCALSIAIVWLIVTILFVYLKTKSQVNFWQAFVWAVPASCMVVLRMNRRFRSNWVLFTVGSLLIWTLLAAFYLQFIKFNLWLIFILGIPMQAISIIWLIFRKFK